MKALSFANKLFLGVAVLLATTAFAAEKGSMKLIQPAVVGGVQLTPGEYNLSWEGTGPNLDVKVTKDGKSIATIPARAIELKETPSANGTATKLGADGKTAVSEVFFRGKTRALEIAPDAQGQPIAATK
jgi:hypothetical protein